jgi:hypothetical protein
VRIPECVVRFIRSISPSDDGQYTGHRDCEEEGGNDDNNEDDDNLVNSSFHEVEDEASPKIVDFESGQSIRLSLHFKSTQYNAEHVRQIILESPIKDGRSLTMKSCLPQPHFCARMNQLIRHYLCSVLGKQMNALSSLLQ